MITKSLTGAAAAAVVSSALLAPTPAAAWKSTSDAQLINKMIHALSPSKGHYRHKHSDHGHKYNHNKKYHHYKKHHRYGRYNGYHDPYWKRGFTKRYGWKRDAWVLHSRHVGHLDLQVFFRIGSAELSPRAYRILDSLGEALSYGRLRYSYFLIGGHTDASGSYDTNQYLSERRAYAVKRYLTRYHGIQPRRLVAVGFGEERLAYPGHPYAKKNRRVEVSVISKVKAYRLRHRQDRNGDYAQY